MLLLGGILAKVLDDVHSGSLGVDGAPMLLFAALTLRLSTTILITVRTLVHRLEQVLCNLLVDGLLRCHRSFSIIHRLRLLRNL